jgi:hypothetical protein
MKPKLLSDVLRRSSPRKMYSNINRYHVLARDASPADSIRSEASFRSRSQSIKRKTVADPDPEPDTDRETAISYADVTGANTGNNIFPAAGQLEEDIVKVRSIVERATEVISNTEVDPNLIPIFSLITEAMLGICDNQAKLASKSTWKPVVHVPVQQVNNVAKKPRGDNQDINYVDLASLRTKSTKNSQEPAVDPQVQNFCEAVKDAEKSTLIFNLNLGNVPIMNQDTMGTRASSALGEMAAKVENAKGKIPSVDTLAAIDDVLSVSTGIKFYGRKTKSFAKKNDPNSGAYCTLPVRYDFQCKEDRIEAESLLREKCKIQCSTPYPNILRESIRQVIEVIKADYPNNFVRVAVDTGNMLLKIARRPMLDAGDKSKKVWTQVGSLSIPKEALDVSARSIPENFKVNNIPRKLDTATGTQNSAQVMEIDVTVDGSATGTGSGPRNSPKKISPGKAKKNLGF